MSIKRLWLIAGGAVAAIAVIILLVIAFTPTASEAEPTPSPTPASASPPPSPSATPTPTPTPTVTSAPPSAAATCVDVTNAKFDLILSQNDWELWQTNDEQYGARPFDVFPNGSPSSMVLCRAGIGKEVATDNILDLAWAPVDPESAVAAMQQLEAAGYQRIDAPEGVYLAMPGVDGGWQDDEGYAETYLFTPRDVRWAALKSDLKFMKAPGESR